MFETIKADKTMLVSGPVSITLLKGKATALGAVLPLKEKVVVRKGRTLPVEVDVQSNFEIITGVGGNIEEVSGSTIPATWKGIGDDVARLPKPCTIMILGNVDCGKTTFSIFLANKLISASKVAILDADIGQSDIGPPTTIGLGVLSRPITDLFSVEAESIGFIGFTSPSTVEDRVLQETDKLYNAAKELEVDTIIVNTDGWVQGKEARNFKVAMTEKISPDVVIGIQKRKEIEHILNAVKDRGFRTYPLSASNVVRKRSKKERKALREQGYRKFLKNTTIRQLPISWVQLENTFLSSEKVNIERLKELERLVNLKIAYSKENKKTITMILKKPDYSDKEETPIPLEIHGKKIQIIWEGDEKNLLTGLLDNDEKFLGLGIIQEIDYQNQVLKLSTPYEGKISIVRFGQVKIDPHGNEIELSKTFSY